MRLGVQVVLEASVVLRFRFVFERSMLVRPFRTLLTMIAGTMADVDLSFCDVRDVRESKSLCGRRRSSPGGDAHVILEVDVGGVRRLPGPYRCLRLLAAGLLWQRHGPGLDFIAFDQLNLGFVSRGGTSS